MQYKIYISIQARNLEQNWENTTIGLHGHQKIALNIKFYKKEDETVWMASMLELLGKYILTLSLEDP